MEPERPKPVVHAIGAFVVRHERWCAALVLALLACNLFIGLGSEKVNDFEEGRYGVTAYEMLQHRSFVVSTYAGSRELWAFKPPLGYWLEALSFAIFGATRLALRLPSALAALATAALTMFLARRWFNRRVAILAGLIVATAYGYLSHHGARSGDFDSGLTLVLLLAASQLPGLAESPWRVVWLGLTFACGFLLKSFGIVPMLLVTAVYLVATGTWRRQRWGPILVAAGVFAAIVGGWAIARWQADGSPDFLLRMVREDVVARSTSIVDKSTSSPFGYLETVFDRFAPWPLLMLAAALLLLRRGLPPRFQHRRTEVLLACWLVVPFLFISAVRTQHHWYLDPFFPPLAMLAASCALFLLRRTPARLRTVAILGLVAVPLAFCEARLIKRILIDGPTSADQRFLAALKPTALGACREIRSTCRLLYSERFVLEVLDGFQVTEPPAGPVGAWPPAAAGGAPRSDLNAGAPACLLVGKSPWRRPLMPAGSRLPAGDLLVAANRSYAVYRAAGPADPH